MPDVVHLAAQRPSGSTLWHQVACSIPAVSHGRPSRATPASTLVPSEVTCKNCQRSEVFKDRVAEGRVATINATILVTTRTTLAPGHGDCMPPRMWRDRAGQRPWVAGSPPPRGGWEEPIEVALLIAFGDQWVTAAEAWIPEPRRAQIRHSAIRMSHMIQATRRMGVTRAWIATTLREYADAVGDLGELRFIDGVGLEVVL